MNDEQMHTSPRELLLSVGSETAPYGRTDVRLYPDGRVDVVAKGRVPDTLDGRDDQQQPEQRKREDGHQREAHGELPSEEARQLLERALRGLPARDLGFPERTGLPDETIVRWELVTDAGMRVHRMWLDDAEEDPQLGPVVARLRTTVDEIGGGQIIL